MNKKIEIVKVLKIQNKKGLHARACAKFVQKAEKYDATIEVEKDGVRSSGNSIVGLLTLAASCHSTITVYGRGPEAVLALQDLEQLVSDFFHEAE